MNKIVFGTSGWRGILAEDFTFENVRVVTQAIADHLVAEGAADDGVVVGYDARFMGRRFAHEACRVLAGSGIRSWICNRDTPTPVIAHEVLARRAGAAINFTASHNPCEYNGLKFSPASGGPALPETTRDIEERANRMLGQVCYRDMPLDRAVREGLVVEIDPLPAYFETLRRRIDFAAIAASGLKIAVNPLYGTGRGYLDRILREAGVEVVTFNDHIDPTFGGLPPEPAETCIADFIAMIRSDAAIGLGLATDGDADRYGIVDGDGSYYEPNYILALLADYLLRVKGEAGDVARSVATSHFVDAVARSHGRQVLETPVGFKYIGEYIAAGKVLIGGEESAGLTIRDHVPDKDGILACLLVAEMVAVTGRGIGDLLADLYERVGEFYTRRSNIRLTDDLEQGYAARMNALPERFADLAVIDVVTIDGYKCLLENGAWLLFRKSGTEPVVRLYGEARDAGTLERILQAGEAFLTG
ncbi:phosphoglucomutase/phosphomannomutase family protein [Geothermobacter hydrogeniphilus]|uniref:Phosphoglucomutase n=1 Tax=Geothermobacter hydrogeniphilus TaxID=1969733 RepID=A0A1X0YDM5_9BACT|nr:phosphoglucomutase/phosphomannomutase family protein [Geothermobacter hydrogeniphilus]ORJ63311.1 phosphoglucomutase [Geothermobacter hydrogeniphilus]